MTKTELINKMLKEANKSSYDMIEADAAGVAHTVYREEGALAVCLYVLKSLGAKIKTEYRYHEVAKKHYCVFSIEK